MARIKPFRGFLYDCDGIKGDYARVMAPPYDVISGAMQEELYRKSPYNIVRLILGKSLEGDDERNNKYVRAKQTLDKWCAEGILKEDGRESIYVYVQEYEDDKGVRRRRGGFIALMKIEDAEKGTILPHERTHSKPKQDRLNLIRQVKGNLSPIFVLYEDKEGFVRDILEKSEQSSEPVIDVDWDGQRHKLWRLSDPEAISGIASYMEDKKTFIADGHHRYEVARAYVKGGQGPEGADHVMVYFADLSHKDNLTVMATHRVIKAMDNTDEDGLVSKLKRYFDMTECAGLDELMNALEERSGQSNIFGFFGGKRYFLMTPGDRTALLGLIKENKAREWKELDVSVLHSAVFDGILGVDCVEGNIIYVRDPEEAEGLVREGTHKAAFFLNPTHLDQLKAVAELGEVMPQKSTYFYPKLLTGLVVNRF